MANTITPLIQKIFGKSLPSLRNAASAVRVCRVDFENEVKQKGNVIDLPIPVASSTADVLPGPTPVANTDKVITTKQISLDQWKRSDKIALTAKEMHEIESGDFTKTQIYEQSIALVEGMNAAVLLGMKNASYRRSGTAGTNPYATTDADSIDVRKQLNFNKAPSNDRHLLLGPAAEAAALGIASIKDASLRGAASTKNTGELGTIFGLQHWGDQQIVAHTAGTAAGALTHGTTIGAVGSSSLYLKAATPGTIKKGDLIAITTASVVYQYVATADVASVDTTAAGIAVAVYPPVQATHVSADTWTLQASHSANIGLQRGGYGLAIRPVDTNFLGAGVHEQMTDDQTGLSLVYSFIPEYMQNSMQVSVLYGHGPLRQEWLIRLMGSSTNI
ncbi:MAG: hypothetical protein H0W83_04820 [Planctomycetes bacterium]|nr:hypothetical protein [Planctomycetota bacterium]